MPLAISSTRPAAEPKARASKTSEGASSKYAIAEINAYIAIRDNLLAEAEGEPTSKSIKRAGLANDLVETCLKTPRSPYEAQYLPEQDAARERSRCAAAKVRIAKLQSVAA
jgi:hypothetical protein